MNTESNTITLRIRSWEDFQARKDIKQASWFKFSNRFLEDPDFYDFTAEELLVWVYILSIASQQGSDTIQLDFRHADRVARLNKQVVLSALTKLQQNQIDPVHVTDTLRTRDVHVQKCSLEEKRREEKREEERESKSPQSSEADLLPPLVKIWNEHSGKLAKVRQTNPSRTRKAQVRFKECPQEQWIQTIQRIANSPFCCGQNERGWRATFDWLLQPDTRLKVSEGKYDSQKPKGESTEEYTQRIMREYESRGGAR